MNARQNLQGNESDAMDFRFLFLEPQGRLAPRPFARGFLLLTGATLIVTVLSIIAAPGISLLQYALIFPYLCLFGKRLHDAGLSAWLWLAYLLGWGFINMVLTSLLLPVLSPQAFEMQVEINKLMETSGFNAAFRALAEQGPEIARASAVTTVAAFLGSSAVTGFAAFRMRTDPRQNRHGPPADGQPSTFD